MAFKYILFTQAIGLYQWMTALKIDTEKCLRMNV